ncbi:type IV pilin protein [Pseudoalteromonas byunsanensis]|nr:type IV pilin protein [Pseudoalteromonas byunsanensis]
MMKSKNSVCGFTLLEALIVLVILGIVVSVAYPSYQAHVVKAARAEAIVLLLDAANRQEQYYVDNRTYTDTLSDIGVSETTERGYYTISLEVKDNEFVVKATPVAGPVKNDTQCTVLKINELGQKLSTGSGSAKQCWNQK